MTGSSVTNNLNQKHKTEYSNKKSTRLTNLQNFSILLMLLVILGALSTIILSSFFSFSSPIELGLTSLFQAFFSKSNMNASTFEDRTILPDNVVPCHYDLYLKPDLDSFTFDGTVHILVNVVKQTDTITVNTNDLQVSSATIKCDQSGKVMASIFISTDVKKEQTSFKFPDSLNASQKYTLSIIFSGIISDKLAGFYKSSYIDSSGKENFMAVTQFEPTDARRAFPCWDEPNKKATFKISLEVKKSLTALSNMDSENVTAGLLPAWKVLHFPTTPIMSTYLIAFVVGELDVIETKTDKGIPVRVFAPIGSVEQGRFALDVGRQVLTYFEEYFDQEYVLPKMDMVAIPDFGSGAMENWGLVTYRTTALLFDEQSSSLSAKERVAYVVAHELAHQWFGNLVTMEWWSDLWLNEGFATWVGWLAVDKLFPSWHIWTRFVNEDLQSGLSLDGLRATHAIEVPVRDPADITEIFDAISYRKGASVIRMLESYLGHDTFQKGLRAYLKKHSYGNARTSDLWQSLEEASGKPVASMMNGWTKSPGYPLLQVSEENNGLTLVVSQNRFLSTGDALSKEESAQLWQVPLNVEVLEGTSTDSGTSQMKSIHQQRDWLLETRQGEFNLPRRLTANDIYKLNIAQVGFYRVQYPEKLMDTFGRSLHAFMTEDRIGLINDAFVLGIGGYYSSTVGLGLVSNLSRYKEREHVVWMEVAGQLGRMKSVWFEQDEVTRDGISRLIKSLFVPLTDELGWDYPPGESEKTVLLRNLALGQALSNDNPAALKEVKMRYNAFIKGDSKALHPNIRGVAFAAIVKYGGREEYDQVFSIYEKENVADQKIAALSALAATRVPELIHELLSLTFVPDKVRSQDVIYIYRSIVGNRVARRPTWKFVKENWSAIYDRFSKGSISLLSSIVSSATGSLASLKDATDIETFFANKSMDGFSRSVSQSLERIRIAAHWINRDDAAIRSWLNEHVDDF